MLASPAGFIHILAFSKFFGTIYFQKGEGLVHILMLMAFVQKKSGSIIDHNSYVNPKYGTGPSVL